MKKLFSGLLAAALLVSNNAFARIEYEEVDVEEGIMMDENASFGERRKDEQQRERDARRAARRRMNEARSEDLRAQGTTPKQEKKPTMTDEDRARQKAARKEERACQMRRKEETRQREKAAYEEKNACKMRRKEEDAHKRQCEEVAKKMRRKERKCENKRARECKYNKILECEKRCVVNRGEKVRMARQDREEKLCKWEEGAAAREACENESGMYADLYKLPAWPIHALFWEAKDLFNVTVDYKYATDCYDSNRSGSKSDITRLAFGENPIRVQDILLASKLVAAGTLVQTDPVAPANLPSDQYLKYLANEIIAFNGRAEEYGITFDLGRYIIHKDIAIGIEIPVLYRRNRLRMHSNLSNDAIAPNGVINDGAFGPTNGGANAFLKRYGADPVRFVKDILSAKGINELGGSATGLGDVAVFINGQFNSVWFEKAVIGVRGQFPTGKKASQSKLWAPDLGNGGFTEIMPFAAILFGYNQWINPHFLAQVSFNFGAHVDRRIPRVVNIPANPTGAPVLVATEILPNTIPFGDRVSSPANAAAISQFDTTVKGFGDVISNVKMYKGAEFKFRVGNIFDEFFSCRGALNLYYDFRAKQKDKITGSNTDTFNPDILRQHTNELEHRIGLDYTYQYDLYSRLHLGMAYTFAGMNVPKTFDASGSFNYAF